MIEFIDVYKSFGKYPVLNGLSFRIERGETFAIIGRSGCGKSVILRHMIGLLQPDRGKVIVDGVEVSHANAKVLNQIRLKFGFLFQSGALLNSLNVADNIALSLREHRLLPEPEIVRRVSEVLGLLELKHLEKVMPAELSGGMRKRVALARAIITQPEIILYDEPTTGLDPIMANVINDLIIQLSTPKAYALPPMDISDGTSVIEVSRRGIGGGGGKVTSVVVTHDMKSTFKVADRIALLYQGKIIKTGTPQDFQTTSDPYIKQFVEGSSEGPFHDE